MGKQLGEWTINPGSAATEKKVYVGKGSNYFSKIKVGEFILESGSIAVGDTLLVTSPDYGIVKEKIDILVVNGIAAEKAVRGDLVTFPLDKKITSRDKLYKMVEENNG